MAEGNLTNEKIIFSPEKQKELFDIISVVFSEELKTSNCFILPAVGQKAGTAMREKGFEKANKATFIAAPEYIMKKMLMQLVSLAIQRILNFQQHRMLTMFQRQNRMQFS